MAGWLASLLLGALLLALPPFIPAREDQVTVAASCGFASGWVTLAVLSVRFTGQPQCWAAVPALLFGVSGLLLVGLGSSVRGVLDWAPGPRA